MWLVKSFEDQVLTPTAIALGNFDGVHLGHQQVLSSLCPYFQQEMVRLRSPTTEKFRLPYQTVVTFDPHPREFFSGEKTQLLTPLEEKMTWLKKLGIEQLVLLPFDEDLATLTPQEFVEKIIVQRLQARKISVGEDFRFGHQRAAGVEDLIAIASHYDIEVGITQAKICQYNPQKVRISSSLIRQGLAEGNITQANQMLGRAYTLTGKVIKGQQLGQKLGFPTANLQLPTDKLLPRYGVYAVEVIIEDPNRELKLEGDSKSSLVGVMNIGCRPTVGGSQPTVEVHLLDWSGNLYDCTLTVSLKEFIRPEQKFPSLDALKKQIEADTHQAQKIFLESM